MVIDPVPLLRPAVPADLAARHRLIERAYRGDAAGWTHEAALIEGPRLDADELARSDADPARLTLVAEADGRILGQVEIADLGQGRAYLGLLAVATEGQAQGLGRRLLEAGEAAARDRFGARAIELTVVTQRDTLIAWYERRGYRATGERRPFPPLGPGRRFVGAALTLSVFEKAIR